MAPAEERAGGVRRERLFPVQCGPDGNRRVRQHQPLDPLVRIVVGREKPLTPNTRPLKLLENHGCRHGVSLQAWWEFVRATVRLSRTPRLSAVEGIERIALVLPPHPSPLGPSAVGGARHAVRSCPIVPNRSHVFTALTARSLSDEKLMKSRVDRILPTLFFSTFLLVGLSVYSDFGVHIDEYHNQKFGSMWGWYVDRVLSSGDVPLVDDRLVGDRASHNLCHGPFWEVTLYYLEKLYLRGNGSPRDVILTRHLANFLLFYIATIFFYLICINLFSDIIISLTGTMILIGHPRILADSFYNTVDLAFLSFSIISIYTALKYLESPRFVSAAVHAFACALLVDTRVAGLIVPFTTTLVFAVECALSTRSSDHWRRLLGVHSAFLAIFCAAVMLFWPFLWREPITHFFESLQGGLFPGKGFDVFYNLEWIMMTTPVGFLVLFVFGISWSGFYASNVLHADRKVARAYFTAMLLVLIPLEATIAADTFLFDGWRHHYFIYPPFVILCTFGVSLARLRFGHGPLHGRLWGVLAATVVGLSLTDAMASIATYHPFQYTYVNPIAGCLQYTHSNYLAGTLSSSSRALAAEDYWSVSNKQALEFILEFQPEGRLSIHFTRMPPKANNRFILPKASFDRIKLAENTIDADYVIDDFDVVRGGIREVKYGKLLKLLKIRNNSICAIYQCK